MPPAGSDPPTILGSGRTLGLSGDTQRVLKPRPELRWFAQYLQRHRATGDLVADPTPLWDGAGRAGGAVGLRRHLVAERGPGEISDVLLIVNRDDWARAREQRDGRWLKLARGLLSERLLAYCIANGLPTGAAGRDLGVQLVGDGGAATGGELLGLGRGEFVTALLPNHHLGGKLGQQGELSVHMHIPGQWPGYREVARLYAGQAVLTLGDHWLDNFRHPSLRAPALYQLHRGEDGGLVHLVNPDLARRFRVVTRESAAGQPVVALEDRAGRAIAFLAVTPTRPEGLTPIGELGDVTLQTAHDTFDESGPGASLTPSLMGVRLFTLVEQGALLQRVHFRSVMTGYDVHIGRQGELGSALADPAARLQVDATGVSLEVLAPGLSLDGRPLSRGDRRALEGDHELLVGSASLSYRDLSGVAAEGWPYLAELRRPGGSVHTAFGGRFRVGRDRGCRVRLPDDRRNDNIHWRDTAGGDIQSRHGSLPRDRFCTDSILVASEHAEVDLTSEPVVYGIARSCWTYVRRGGDVLALPPSRRAGTTGNTDLLPGDELLVGNCVFEVAYEPADAPVDAAALPRDRGPLSAAELAAAADDLVPAAPPRLPRREDGVVRTDVPAAAGLGERGPTPPRPRLDPVDSVDSLLDEVLEPTLPALPPEARPRQAPAVAGVVVVDEATVQVERARPARLVLLGWRCAGRMRIGNHADADAVLPELTSGAAAGDLLTAESAGGDLVLRPGPGGDVAIRVGRSGEARVTVPRRDARGAVDLGLVLELSASPAGEVALDLVLDDAFARGLFTLGLPLRVERACRLGGHAARARFDGQVVHVAFEDPPPGTPERRMLSDGDKLLVGAAVYRLEVA